MRLCYFEIILSAREETVLIKRKFFFFIVIVTSAIIMFFGYFYYSYVSNLIFKESATHLTEIYSQVGHSLSNLLSENWSAMNMWIPYLNDTDDDGKIKLYIENIRNTSAFTDFYFLNKDGSYCTIGGDKGSMDLGKNMKKLMDEGQNVVSDTALIDRSELVVFAVPCPEGTYMNFSYSAIAISFNNDDIVSLLSAKTFNDNAVNYVIYPDGRVVVNNRGEHGDKINNFWRMLTERSNSLNEDNIQQYRSDICYNVSGVDRINIDGEPYYLTYESIGFKDWILIGIVPTDIVNSNINSIQSVTMSASVSVVVIIASLSILYLLQKNYVSIRQRDTEIRYREELFSVLSNNVDDIFLMLSAADFSVGYVSPNIERILGISHSDAMADVRIIEDSVKSGKNGAVREKFMGLSDCERKEWDSEYIHRTSGQTLWFHVTALRNKISGDDKYILVLSDRTKERKANLALHHAVNVAKQANNAKSSFLSNISHDIRTPLNAIIGFATLAGNETDNPEVTKDYLSKILTSGKQLLGLVSDILDISVIESGRLTFNITEVDLSQLLYEIRTVISNQAAEKHQTLTVSMNGVKHETVRCDRHRLEQLFINFLSNAIKFTQKYGKVSLVLTENSTDKNGISEYEIHVIDNGIGMSKEFTEKIFDPFEREGIDKNAGGTGLGMPISKSIVDAAGGSITLHTQQGKGTEFTIKLPFETVFEQKTVSDCKHLSALIISDNEKHTADTAKTLRKLGVESDCFGLSDVSELGGITKNKSYDIFVSDVQSVDPVSVYLSENNLSDITCIVITENLSELSLSKYPDCVSGVCLFPLLTYDIRRILNEHCSAFDDSDNAENERKQTHDEAIKVLNGKYILLAEDVIVNVQIVKAILAKYNVNIEVAADGRKALEMFSNNPDYYYDVILMDLQMPIMDGYDSTREIRSIQSDYAKNIPIIAMTANAFSDDMDKARQCGMNDFLIKPVGIDELAAVLMRAVKEEKQ